MVLCASPSLFPSKRRLQPAAPHRPLLHPQTPDKRSKGIDRFGPLGSGDIDPSVFPGGLGGMSSSMAGRLAARGSGLGDIGGGAGDPAHMALLQVRNA